MTFKNLSLLLVLLSGCAPAMDRGQIESAFGPPDMMLRIDDGDTKVTYKRTTITIIYDKNDKVKSVRGDDRKK